MFKGFARVLFVALVAFIGALSCSVEQTGATSSAIVANVVLLAEKSISLGASNVVVGDVEVRQILPSTTTQFSVGASSKIGTDAACNPTNTIIAESVSVPTGACVGNVQTDHLSNSGTTGAQSAFPTTPLAPPPLVLGTPPSGSTISVPSSTTMTINPGAYGNVNVGGHATLRLNAGAYTFGNVTLIDFSTLTTTGGTVTVLAKGFMMRRSTSAIGLANASELQINTTASFATDMSVTIRALVAAPHGTITIGDTSQVTGALSAFNISARNGVTFTFESGFAPSPHGVQQLSGYYGQHMDGSFAAISPVERTKTFELSIGLPIPAQAALTAFIADVSNPTSPNYRHFLTPAQFKAQFGASDSDYQRLIRWAGINGLTVVRTYSNNLLLSVSGTAPQVEAALSTNLFYREGGPVAPGFIAVDREPSLSSDAPPIRWISGFTDYKSGHRACTTLTNPNAGVTSGLNVGTSTAPFTLLSAADLRQAYIGDPRATIGLTSTPSSCQALTGAGQHVGILSLEGYSGADAVADALMFQYSQPPGTPFGFTGNIAVVDLGTLLFASAESPLDIQAVMAMAPGADITVIETAAGLVSHPEDAYTMFAEDASITVVTSSYYYPGSPNIQQALAQLAAQGASTFTSSGDFGDVGDPLDVTDMDYQTLVGGTILQGANVITALDDRSQKVLLYSHPYIASESTWNQGCPAFPMPVGDGINDITGGGIMNGCGAGGSLAKCYPAPYCCTSGGTIPIPGYQAFVPVSPFTRLGSGLADTNGGNGGSSVYRNFPDVAADAQNFQIVFGFQPGTPSPTPGPNCASGSTNCITRSDGALLCCVQGQGGTSLSSPLWAGFAALMNQQAQLNGVVARNGFLNPALYAIGLTRGQTPPFDLYTGSFNDIADGVFNQLPQPPPINMPYGFPAVKGYDLATGWGSPTCSLLQLFGSTAPTAAQRFTQLSVHIESGTDGLNAASSADLWIDTVQFGSLGPFELKAANTSLLHDGDVRDLTDPLISRGIFPPPREA